MIIIENTLENCFVAEMVAAAGRDMIGELVRIDGGKEVRGKEFLRSSYLDLIVIKNAFIESYRRDGCSYRTSKEVIKWQRLFSDGNV